MLEMRAAGFTWLWYNSPPAEIYMGDAGSIGFGGAIGMMFVLLKIAHPVWMLVFLVLTALTFSLLGFIIGIWADGFEKLQIVPLLIISPLTFLGVADELTGPGRLTEDGVAYVPPPGPDLPYFRAANARDPRAGIVHEGAHYQQLALAWRNPRPVRRHYYDSGANEGIAFYNEEMMLVSGLVDDAPHTRTVLCNFMRLRALRVTTDVGLATGALSITDAAADLAARVPMDEATAREEAAFFAETPGQALTYQIGKTQLIALIADAARMRPDLDLQRLHDAIWVNGNVPVALLRWELLGLTDELAALDPGAG